jgi:MFS transporter, PAT family, beta-lactamase induction signal transducer AmpG
MHPRRLPPVWLMGLSGTSFGLVGGFDIFVLAQALAAQGVPETTISTVSAIAISPGFYSFLVSPMLDVWFSRRSYAAVLTIAAALLVGASVLLLHHLFWLEVTATLAYAAIQLSYSALGGWLSTVSGAETENRLSAWLTVANIAGFGSMALLGGELLRGLSAPAAAIAIGAVVLLPVLIFPSIPAHSIPAQNLDRRLAGESFQAFWNDVFALLRRRDVLIAIALFVAPCATFSLTNMLGGFGGDFHASPRAVSVLGGTGGVAAGVCGSLLLPLFAKGIRLRPLYLAIGIAGALFTAGIALLPHTPWCFALAVVGENAFQSIAIAASIAITFEAIGQNNPLAATNFAVLTAAYNVPISYMLLVDGYGYGLSGVQGAFVIDAAAGGAACLLAGMLLVYRRPRGWRGGTGRV